MIERLVLCYHAVADDWESTLAVTTAALRDQLQSLLSRGYRGATFTEAMVDPPASRTVAVTFDDAYRSVYDRALPILSELGLPGTVFVPTDFAGRDTPMNWPGIDSWVGSRYEDELLCMSWENARQLRAEGWEVGSHTRSHPDLTEVEAGQLAAELQGSREVCEREVGAECRAIAYPYGAYDARVREAVRKAGYAAAAGMPGRHRSADVLHWPRVGVYPIDGPLRFRVKTWPLMRWLRSSPAWEAVQSARARIRVGSTGSVRAEVTRRARRSGSRFDRS